MHDARKFDKYIYHSFYIFAKGNQFKNKYVLFEIIHTMKAEKAKEKALAEQAETRKGHANARLARKAEREQKRAAELSD
eukprot:13800003-Ditylum_brightwellii.AAC.1